MSWESPIDTHPDAWPLPADRWRCSVCGSERIQCSYPIWIEMNAWEDGSPLIDDFVDSEAQPYKDSDTCHCPDCSDAGREDPVLAVRGEGE